MGRTVMGALVITTVLVCGGLFEHNSALGAAVIGWMVPVSWAVILYAERKERINKAIARRKRKEAAERAELLAELKK